MSQGCAALVLMGREQIAALSEVARPQRGCFSLDQARRLGLGEGQIRGLADTGVIRRVHPRVFAFTSCELTDAASTWAALLQGGASAVVSHEAAIRAHGIGHVPFRPVVTVPPGHRHDMTGIRVHRFCDLLGEHVVDLGGMRTTSLPRAVVDVTSVFSRLRLEDLVDRLTIIERACTVGGIARAYRLVNRQGRRNIARLGEVLDARSAQASTSRSELERRVDELVVLAGLTQPLHEMPIPSLDQRPGLVDRAWPEAMLILEIDGRSWHSRDRAMAVDRARDRTAGRVGWYTARVLGEEVRDHPELVIDDLRGLFAVRRAQLFPSGVAPIVAHRSGAA